MGLNSILIIAGLVIGSGLIAFFGDWFGTKLGKARVSIFGLRPRRTANVITVFTGIVIAGLTLSFLVLVSEGVRARLLEMDKLLRQRQTLQADNRTLQARLENKSAQLNAIEGHNRQLLRVRDSLQTRIVALQQDLGKTRGEITHLRADRKKAEADLAAARARLQKMEETLHENEARVQALASDLNASSEQLAKVEAQITENKATIATQERVINNQLNVIRSNDEELRTKDAELRQKLSELQAKEDELRALEERLVATELHSITGVIELRKSGLTYRRGEEVARAVVDGSQPEETVETALRDLLKRAGDAAEQRGAAKAADGTGAVEVLAGKLLTPGGAEQRFTAEDKIAAVIDEISQSRHSTVVLITAALNAFEGEPVKVDFELYWNQFTFDKGEKLAETRIDGTKPKDKIFSDLMAFISGAVREKAEARGIIPQNGQYVQVSYGELIQAMDEIRASRRVKVVAASSATQCWAGDQVTVRLAIK